MSSLLINPTSESDIKLILDLLKKMHIPVKVLSEENKLDIGLLNAMEATHDDDYVSEDRIMKILNKNDNKIQKQL